LAAYPFGTSTPDVLHRRFHSTFARWHPTGGRFSMLQSHIIDIDGVFIGVAIRLDKGFRFIANDPRVEDLGETIWPRFAG
jgi:hypothetical protein